MANLRLKASDSKRTRVASSAMTQEPKRVWEVDSEEEILIGNGRLLGNGLFFVCFVFCIVFQSVLFYFMFEFNEVMIPN